MKEHNKKPTIQDVAKLAGVSITTVSRVMNKNYPVKASTKEKVQEAIDELNFKPNLLARGLIVDKTRTIGILTPSIENLFFSEVIKGIDGSVRAKDYNTFLCITEGIAENEQQMIETLMNRSVDAIISIDPRTDNIKSGYYEKLSIPVILINGYSKDIECNYVLNDEGSGLLEALNYLKELGHKNIGFIRGGKSFSYDIKEQMYKRFMKDNEYPFDEASIIRVKGGNELDTVQQTKKAVEKQLSVKCTALIACNDWMAVGALNGATARGMNVPNDLSIIGFDNTIISQITEPSLTTVDQNMSALGELAAKRMFEIIKDKPTENKKIILKTKLVIRDSCKKIVERM